MALLVLSLKIIHVQFTRFGRSSVAVTMHLHLTHIGATMNAVIGHFQRLDSPILTKYLIIYELKQMMLLSLMILGSILGGSLVSGLVRLVGLQMGCVDEFVYERVPLNLYC